MFIQPLINHTKDPDNNQGKNNKIKAYDWIRHKRIESFIRKITRIINGISSLLPGSAGPQSVRHNDGHGCRIARSTFKDGTSLRVSSPPSASPGRGRSPLRWAVASGGAPMTTTSASATMVGRSKLKRSISPKAKPRSREGARGPQAIRSARQLRHLSAPAKDPEINPRPKKATMGS